MWLPAPPSVVYNLSACGWGFSRTSLGPWAGAARWRGLAAGLAVTPVPSLTADSGRFPRVRLLCLPESSAPPGQPNRSAPPPPGGRGPRPRCGQVRSPEASLPRRVDGRPLHLSSRGRVSVGVSSDKDTGQMGPGPTHGTSLCLKFLFKHPTSKHSPALRCWGSGFSVRIGGPTVQHGTSFTSICY